MSLINDDSPHPVPLPDEKWWSENYCFSGFDPQSGIGFWLHTGRWILDPTIWREVVIIRFADGTVAAHRGYGNATLADNGPGGPNFAIRVLEPKRRFGLHFDGAIRRVHTSEMAGQLLQDGPVVRLKFDLEFTSDRPIWDMHGVSDSQDFAGTGHIEQIGHATGPIRIGSETHHYDGLAHRDHSRGPRDASKLKTHHWLQGQFSDGRAFALYHAILWGMETPAFSKAVVWDGDALHQATIDLPFSIESTLDAALPFSFALTYAGKTLAIDVTAIPTTAFLSFSVPNEEYVGVFPSRSGAQPNVLLEQSAMMRLADGTEGHGMLERSIPGETHREDV
jgi:hypothetical protein